LPSEIKETFESVKVKLAAKKEELADASSRFDRLQGSKERVEAELLQVVKQRREAQLSWTQKRSELEGRLQVLLIAGFAVLSCDCSTLSTPHGCM
jgi:hypothetical protein